jgi:hypothetical protein
VTDEVPAEAEIRGRVHLRQRFLNFVFAEIDLSGARGGAHVIGAEGFGNGDEADGSEVSVGPAGGARDPIANAVEPGSECVYFGIDQSITS